MFKKLAGGSRGQGFFEFAVVAVFLLFAIAIVAWIIATPFIAHNTVQEFNGQLVRYVPEKDSNALMVIKNLDTGENETFTNEDSLWMWKWNSRDYLALDEGKNYHFKVNWFRWASIFSQSRNVLEVTPLGN